jgi:N-acetylneuraminic acid mutarotase
MKRKLSIMFHRRRNTMFSALAGAFAAAVLLNPVLAPVQIAASAAVLSNAGLFDLSDGNAPSTAAPAASASDGVINWRLEKTTGEKPAPRGGGKWVAIGKKLYTFGGFRECFDKTKCDHTFYDDMYVLDVANNHWSKVNPTFPGGPFPGKRVFPGAACYQNKKTAIIFGGCVYNATVTSLKVYGDLWEYNPQTNTMVERKPANQGPNPRLGAEVVIAGDTLYLFGGYDQSRKNHNDLWSYDLLTNTWRQLKPEDDPGSPSKRYIFRFEPSPSGDDAYIFGGNYREKLTIQRNDTWKYNFRTNTFTELVSEKATNTTGRTHGASAAYGDQLIIAMGDIPNGGCFTNQDSEHQNPTNDVYSLNVGKGGSLWKKVQIGEGPPPLKRVFYARVGNRLYLTLGFDYKCDNPATAGPLYNENTYSLPLNQIK